ncbi:TatD family hydrolase [Halosquirtibacter xylanolyticus]|uniref:TatD family hydrolase n=1 Tax=Halosquirtibacter xylanolyticus TaxID=3374599 RepID=UPI003747EE3A|nr:TatD family hydrolase [Prolixibacteraceae bacterium]
MSSKYINIHTHSNLSSDQTNIISIYSHSIGDSRCITRGYYSIGVHPWDVESLSIEAVEQKIMAYLQDERCVAIGEIGLDYHRNLDHDLQRKVFGVQLRLANKCHKPVILHVVKSYHDILSYWKENQGVWIFHAFQGSEEFMLRFIDAPVYFSLGIREVNRLKKMNLIHLIPLDKLFLETDDKGDTIEEVYAHFCVNSGYPLEMIKKCIFGNFCKVFKDVKY